MTQKSPATKFLWVESRIAPPGGHRIGELGLTAIGLTLGVDYDRANAAELPAVNFDDYTAIAVASSFGGLLTRAELDALIARAADIQSYVNGGGGLFAGAECTGTVGCDPSLLGTAPPLFGFDGDRVSKEGLTQGIVELNPDSRYIVNVGSVGQPRDRQNNNAKYGPHIQ